MATEVITTEDIILMDGTTVTLRPLSIAKMRKFLKIWSEHTKMVRAKLNESEGKEEEVLDGSDITDAQFDAFMKMCALGLDSLKGEKNDEQFLAYLEDILDEQMMYRVLEKTGGFKSTVAGDDSPNQMPPM